MLRNKPFKIPFAFLSCGGVMPCPCLRQFALVAGHLGIFLFTEAKEVASGIVEPTQQGPGTHCPSHTCWGSVGRLLSSALWLTAFSIIK